MHCKVIIIIIIIIIISDCLHHDNTAVYNILEKFLPERLHPKKTIYFSDGAASQYKNRKNFVNLCLHKDDFGLSAE